MRGDRGKEREREIDNRPSPFPDDVWMVISSASAVEDRSALALVGTTWRRDRTIIKATGMHTITNNIPCKQSVSRIPQRSDALRSTVLTASSALSICLRSTTQTGGGSIPGSAAPWRLSGPSQSPCWSHRERANPDGWLVGRRTKRLSTARTTITRGPPFDQAIHMFSALEREQILAENSDHPYTSRCWESLLCWCLCRRCVCAARPRAPTAQTSACQT
jgi:hypothetical protein